MPELLAYSHRAIRPLQSISVGIPETDAQARYRSQILSVTPNIDVRIRALAYRGEEIVLPRGKGIEMEVTLPNGIWLYSARVLGRVQLPEPSILLSWPAVGEQIQRRDHARIEIALRTDVVPAVVAIDRPERGVISGRTIDLSAGGVSICLPQPLEVGEEFQLRLHLRDGISECDARVVRCGRYPVAEGELGYWTGAEFSGISGTVSRRITRLVFDIGRERLRSRLS